MMQRYASVHVLNLGCAAQSEASPYLAASRFRTIEGAMRKEDRRTRR